MELGNIVWFIFGVLVTLMFELLRGGFSELGKKFVNKMAIDRHYKKKRQIYDYIEESKRKIRTTEEVALKFKIHKEKAYILLEELEKDRQIRKINIDQQTKATTSWRAII